MINGVVVGIRDCMRALNRYILQTECSQKAERMSFTAVHEAESLNLGLAW